VSGLDAPCLNLSVLVDLVAVSVDVVSASGF